MLNRGLRDSFCERAVGFGNEWGEDACGGGGSGHAGVEGMLFEVTAERFMGTPELREEAFGPGAVVVRCRDVGEAMGVVRGIGGSLTGTVHVGAEDAAGEVRNVIRGLEGVVGRVIVNGYPTGVEVCHAMVHGGPWPATSEANSTSVGTGAIGRFARMVAFQDVPDGLLPAALQDGNPLGIWRVVNGERTKGPIREERLVQQIHLNGLDLTVFIVYMLLAVGLGFVVSIGRKKTTRGYFLGGKTLPWYVIATSMLASDVSSEHFIANAGIGYTYGIVAATGSWNCWIIYTIFIWIFLPYYVRTNLYTIPEFLERRYNTASADTYFRRSLLVGYVGAIFAGTLYAGGLAFERMLGPFIEQRLVSSRIRITRSSRASFSSRSSPARTRSMAGLRSAAWTDFMQIIILGIGGVLVPILGLRAVGGFWRAAARISGALPGLLAGDARAVSVHRRIHGISHRRHLVHLHQSQHMVQRVLAAKDEWHARMGVIGAGTCTSSRRSSSCSRGSLRTSCWGRTSSRRIRRISRWSSGWSGRGCAG